MIRINLLASERKVAAVKKKVPFETGQKLTVACSLILVVTALGVGWRYWSLGKQSVQLDVDLVAAQKEAAQLHSVLAQVQQFEQRKSQLQERVSLIEQLRHDQAGPVHMLDQVSKALPSMLWLTELKQQEANPNEVLITGKCTNLTSLSDFVANLEASGYFKRSVEIVNSKTDPSATPPGEIVTFSVRALFQRPGQQAEETAAKNAKADKPAKASAKGGR
jgi:type IV pilus assembly protein PilN